MTIDCAKHDSSKSFGCVVLVDGEGNLGMRVVSLLVLVNLSRNKTGNRRIT